MSEKTTVSEGQDTTVKPNMTTAAGDKTTFKQGLTYFAFISPYWPIFIIWEHRYTMSQIAPEEDRKLQRLREVMADDVTTKPMKSSMKIAGTGFAIAGVLQVISFICTWIDNPAHIRWYSWFSLANGVGMFVIGVAYCMGHGDTLFNKVLEIECIEKWKTGMLFTFSQSCR